MNRRKIKKPKADTPVTLLQHPNLITFKQHGFTPEEESSGDNVIGNCIFCGGDKFFINPQEKKWDCKHCGVTGGFHTWLLQVVEYCIESIERVHLKRLADSRGLTIKTLQAHQIGWNPETNKYTIPIYDMQREKIWDIRIYDGQTVKSTAGCTAGLFGWEDLQRTDFETVWQCEGEWDKMVMWEILQAAGLKRDIVVGVPGANTFKSEWAVYYKDKNVHVIYDNDHDRVNRGKVRKGAGITGAIKVFKALRSAVHDMRFVHWPNKYADGYDLRDYYNDHGGDCKTTLRGLRALFQPVPKDYDAQTDPQEQVKAPTYDGAGISMQTVKDTFQKWLYMPDTTIIDVMFGSIIANRLPGDPLWLFIVDRSGGAKSVFLRAIEECPSIVTTTSVTPHALVSGHTGTGNGDPSLIPRLDGKILAIKDFTTILNMNQTKRDEVFGILRDAYDGKIEWVFGNGKVCSYTSKFGIIAGVTPAIEIFAEGQTALGERFLRFQPPRANSLELERKLMHKALTNTTHEELMQAELSGVSQELLNFDFGALPGAGTALQQKCIYLAQYVSILRGTINRDKYSKEVTHNPFMELGTRLTKQLYKHMLSIGQLYRAQNVDEYHFECIKQVARSTAPTRMQNTIEKMYKAGSERTYGVKQLAEMINLPTLTTNRVLENLTMLKAVKRIKLDRMSKQGDTVQYVLHPCLLELIDSTNLFERSKHATSKNSPQQQPQPQTQTSKPARRARRSRTDITRNTRRARRSRAY
jgi:hypothetical protein